MEKTLHALLGSELDDPSSTWGDTTFRIPKWTVHEESAGNAMHMLLALFGGALLLSPLGSRAQRFYVVLVLAAGMLFCACLRWQPWHSRLHLPLFVLASPIIAIAVSRSLRSRSAVIGFGLVLMLASAPFVLLNPARPLVGPRSAWCRPRQEQYFAHRPDLREPYERTFASGAVSVFQRPSGS